MVATPAQIVRRYLIDLGLIGDSSNQAEGAWPSGVGPMPVQSDTPGEYVAFDDTGAVRVLGRNARIGDRNARPTISIIARGGYAEARAKLASFVTALDHVGVLVTEEGGAGFVPVEVGGDTYILESTTVTGDPLYLGREENKDLDQFTMNVTVLYSSDAPLGPFRYPVAGPALDDYLLGYDTTTGFLSKFAMSAVAAAILPPAANGYLKNTGGVLSWSPIVLSGYAALDGANEFTEANTFDVSVATSKLIGTGSGSGNLLTVVAGTIYLSNNGGTAAVGLNRPANGVLKITDMAGTGVGDLIAKTITVRQPAGTPGVNEMQLGGDGSITLLDHAQNINITSTNATYLWTSTNAGRVAVSNSFLGIGTRPICWNANNDGAGTSGAAIWQSSAGVLTISAVGNSGSPTGNGGLVTGTLRVLGDNNVLQVAGSSPYIYFDDGTAINNFGLEGSHAGFIGTQTAHPFSIRTTNTARITVDASGKVGIGTTSPGTFGGGGVASQLGIVCGATTTVGQVIRGAASQTADLLQLQNSDATLVLTAGRDGNGDGYIYLIQQAGGTGYSKVGITSSSNRHFSLANDWQLKWDSTGSVGNVAPDTGLARSAAGVLKISDGSTGYGALKASNITLVQSGYPDILIGNNGVFTSIGGVQDLSVSVVLEFGGSTGAAMGPQQSGSRFLSSWQYKWQSDDAFGTPDTGFARSAAGVVKVTNGSTGFGDISAGSITTDSAGNTSFIPKLAADGNYAWYAGTNGLHTGHSAQLYFTASDAYNTADAGLARSSAGVVKVTDGGSGLGTIKASGIQVPASSGVGGIYGSLINNNITYQTVGSDVHVFVGAAVSLENCPTIQTNAADLNIRVNVSGSGTNAVKVRPGTGTATLELTVADLDMVGHNLNNGGVVEIMELTAPGAGAADTARIYAEDNGAGKTRIMAKFSDGSTAQLAIQP